MASINCTQLVSDNYASANWTSFEDFHYTPECFYDSNSDAFRDDDDISSSTSGLHHASKKISKINQSAEVQRESAQKRSKRARNPWTVKEDAKLVELMKKYGQSWAMIASVMPGRTGKQVRDRFLNKLRPNIKLGDWSAEEDDKVVTLLKEIGNRWSLIATHLPGRTEGQVKNRFYSYIKKRLQPDGTISHASSSRTSSEGYTSLVNSPSNEERTFDFAPQEFDFTTFNGCVMNNNASLAKGIYIGEEETYSEQTTQNTTPASFSPFRVGLNDPTDVISYDVAEPFFFRQPSHSCVYANIPVQNGNHAEGMYPHIPSFFQPTTQSNNVADVDAFFSHELRNEEGDSSALFATDINSSERLVELSQRKAFLELALAKTLKELKGL